MFGKRKYLIYLLIFFISESFKKPKMVSVNETWKNLFNLVKDEKIYYDNEILGRKND